MFFISIKQHPLYHLWIKNTRWRHKARLGIILSCCNKLCDIAPEILIGIAVDCIVKRERSFLAHILKTDNMMTLLIALATLTSIVWLLESLFEYLQKICWRNLAQDVQHLLRLDAFSHTLYHDLSWFEEESSGNYTTTLSEDIHQLERFLDQGADTIIQLICSTVLILCVFFYLNPILALLSFLPMPFIIGWSRYFHHRLRNLYLSTRSHGQIIAQKLSSIFSGIMVVKSFCRESYEIQKMQTLSKDYVQAQRNAIRLSSAFTPTVRILILLGFLTVLLGGGHLALSGGLEVGAYSAMVYLTQRLLWPFTSLAQIIDDYQRAMASTDRILKFITPISSQTLKSHVTHVSQTLSSQIKEICLKNVCFSYQKNKAQHTLNNISFTARKGEVIGICGSTGSGKSTLAKLLLHFYLPNTGIMTLDGVDCSNYSIADIRKHIGFVSQDNYLFDGSIYDNIIYGIDHVDQNFLNHIMNICSLTSWIASLPDQQNTLIGERGIKLSGGQKQRIALARALLKQSSILILDEATSAIDNETERDLNRAVYNMAHNQITLIIAHRLSTIRHAHRIYVIDNGSIQESGNHDELCAIPNGTYQSLWHIQTEGGL